MILLKNGPDRSRGFYTAQDLPYPSLLTTTLLEKEMKIRYVFLALTIAVSVILVGCAKQDPKPTAAGVVPQGDLAGPGDGPQGATLDKTSSLALGTLRLEGTGNAVTPAQAGELLSLWKAIWGGSLQGQAETDAVLRQIEGKLTDSQRAAIGAMDLTFQGIADWMREQGIEMSAPDASSGRPTGEGVSEQGEPRAFGNMSAESLSAEERPRLREEFQNMTQEQRATRMAEMGAQRPEGGGQRGAPGAPGGFAGRAGSGNFLLDPLIELLTRRAAE